MHWYGLKKTIKYFYCFEENITNECVMCVRSLISLVSIFAMVFNTVWLSFTATPGAFCFWRVYNEDLTNNKSTNYKSKDLTSTQSKPEHELEEGFPPLIGFSTMPSFVSEEPPTTAVGKYIFTYPCHSFCYRIYRACKHFLRVLQ